MAENKTQPHSGSVEAFLQAVENEKKREDAFTLLRLMEDVTGEPPTMWGDTMIGYGKYHYKYASGREGDSFLTGFSPRKDNLTLYIMGGFDQYQTLLDKLGKYKLGKACLYVKKLDDIDLDTLRELVRQSAEHAAKTNSSQQLPPTREG